MTARSRALGCLAVLCLAAILTAQTPAGLSPQAVNPLACSVVASPRIVRYEGMTELSGDLVLTCTGGAAQASGTALSTIDITVSLNTNVTSRILDTTTGASEALLLIDEPGNGVAGPVPGFGTSAPQILCSSILGAVQGGCVEYARDKAVTGGTVQVAANSASNTVSPGANVFRGKVSGNQVTFYGVPILPPAPGAARVFRVTNVRADVAGLPGGNASSTSLTASISTTAAGVNLSNSFQVVGSAQTGLSGSVRDASNSGALASGGASISQCAGSSSPAPLAILRFVENFGTAFVTRSVPSAVYNGQSGAPSQNIPGSIYNAESGFVFPAASNGSVVAGLADFGTRLKASFHNIPPGVRIFVSVTNLAANTSSPTTPAPAGDSSSSYALLVQSESGVDTNGAAPLAATTISVNGTPPTTALAELTVVNGSATAVWEVINANPALSEAFQFGVWQQSPSNTPPAGTATVNLTLAPTFGINLGSIASNSMPVGRFIDLSTQANLFSIAACQGCTYTLSGTTSYPSGASNGSVAVTASAATCAWAASSPVDWVAITAGTSGTGNGTVQFNVVANSGVARNSALTIAGQSFILNQAGTGTKAASTTTLAASNLSPTAGQAVTLTATVSPSTATGAVSFNDVNTFLGTGNLSNGTASFTTSALAAGSHALTAAYNGDNALNGSTSASVTLTVGLGKTATTIGMAAFPNPASVGQTVTLNAVVIPTSATGTVTFKDGSNILSAVTMTNGAAGLITSSLTPGTHMLTASYGGDSTNSASTSAPVIEIINPALNVSTTSLTVAPNPAAAGQVVTLTATVTPTSASGTVTFKDGSTTLGAISLTGGSASLPVSTLTAGSHGLTATYGGDTVYSASTSATVTGVVNGGLTVALAATPNPAPFAQTVTLTVTVSPASATGTASILDNLTGATLGPVALSNGIATIATSNLKVGSHLLQAVYSGDSNNASSKSSPVTETVNPASTTTTFTAAPASSAPGQTVTLTATVSPPTATGTVLFKDAGTSVGIANLVNGTAAITTSTLGVGSHALSASYNGDGNFAASTSIVVTEMVIPPCTAFPTGFVPFLSIASVSQPNSAGDLVAVGAMSLDSYAAYQALPPPAGPNQRFCGTVLLAPGIPVSAYVPTLAERSGDFSAFAGLLADPEAGGTPFPGGMIPASRIPGTVAWRIVGVLQYSGTTLAVTPTQSAPGQSVTMTATVAPSSATGTMTFLDGSITMGTAALNAGVATFTTSTLALGTHTLSASYGGDSKIASSTSNPIIESVVASTTSSATTLTVTPLSSTLGQSVTLTAAVTPSSATGGVTFKDGSTSLGTATLIGGTASFPTTTLTAGSHSLTAVYTGDAKNAASTSNPVSMTVAATTTTTLTVTPTTSTLGQPVTLAATVTPASATGSVTFKDGTAVLGTVALTAGSATFSALTLAAGSHSLTAAYGGDTTNGPSTSNPVTGTVGLQPTTTALTVTPASSTFGQPVVLTAAVTPSSATGTVAFQDGSIALGSAPLSGGVASFSTSALAAGNHSLTAVYSGDSRNATSTSTPASETVAAPSSGTTLSVIPSPSSIGQTVTMTATVNPGSATGNMVFQDGSTPLGTVALTGGTAIFTTSTLTAGNHTLTAVYSGDSKNGGSTSNPVNHSVAKVSTSTALSVSPASSTPGQTVTLTATVTPSSATGNVTFLDSQVVLGTAALTGGIAAYTISSLAVGAHAISASYGGDVRDGGSISTTIAHTVASATPVQITSTAAPVTAFVGTAWSQTFKATGGTVPYKWTMASNTMSDLAMTTSGDTATVSGTPQTAGAYQLSVRVQDAGSQSATTPVNLPVYSPAAIAIMAPEPQTPADQPTPQLSLAQSYPFALTGTLTLSFVPNAPGLPAGYNAALFPDGTTRFAVTIPANSTAPNPPIPPVQIGSVAGDISGTLGPLMITGTAQTIPLAGAPPSVRITLPRLAPLIVAGSVRIVNVTASGFQVILNASSTTRDLTSGAFVFTAAPGTQMTGCTPFCTVTFGPEAAAWFASKEGVANGGATSLTVPFTFNGDTSVIGTVAVTLTNSAGTSAPVSGGR